MKSNISKVLLVVAASMILAACGSSTVSSSSSSSSNPSSSIAESSFSVIASTSLQVDGTYQIVPADVVGFVSSDFSYTSYDTNVVTVSATGLITAVNEGSTTVLVKAGSVRKTITVTVTDPNKLNNVSYRKLAAIAVMPGTVEGTGIDTVGGGGAKVNYAWDGGTNATTATKVDFEGTAENSAIIGRTSVADKTKASVDNGDYVVVMSSQNDDSMPTASAHAMMYVKTKVSELANSFRLWGWASKSDSAASLSSGKGKFRVVAYEFNAEYTSYTEIALKTTDSGSLTQDEHGWIAFQDVDDVANGHILGALPDDLFFYSVKNDSYDLLGKDIILAVEFMGVDKTMPDRFGVKRMGFMLDDAPDFSLTSSSSVEIYASKTSQITLGTKGAAASGVWSFASSDTAVATVDESGLITAKEVGETKTCTITISNSRVSGKEVTVSVTVLPTPSTVFTVPETAVVALGETYSIVPTDQVSCESGFTYETLSSRIATVDVNGVVTGLVPGVVDVKVSCGGLYKFIKFTVTASTLYGLTASELVSMASFGTTGGFPAAWDFTWSGGVTADKVDATGTNLTNALVHAYQYGAGSTVNDVQADHVNMISNISGLGNLGIENALFVKGNIGASVNEFRVWTKSAGPDLPDIDPTTWLRIVFYVANESGTAYVPYVMALNACSDGGAVVSQDASTGIIHLQEYADGNFINFVVPAALKGANDVIISIENFTADPTTGLQNRSIVRRFGFDA